MVFLCVFWCAGLEGGGGCLNIVDRDLLASATSALAFALAVTVLVELEAAVAVLVGAEGVRLVDLGRVWQLAVGFPEMGVSDSLEQLMK